MLERCLLALREQRRPADEIIVVDNSSTDDSAAVARRHGATVVEERRPGITAAASRGYDAATGDIVARCDAETPPIAEGPPGHAFRCWRPLEWQ